MYTFNPSSQEERQLGLLEFNDSLGNIASSRTAKIHSQILSEIR